jgi:hypothetical protein
MDRTTLAGMYQGSYHVQPGREGELTKDEVKRYLKSKENLSLDLRPDGTFSHKGISHGTWSSDGDRVLLHPMKFGNQTREEMERAATDSGRAFTLAFLFDPFELRCKGGALYSPDESALIFLCYQPV